MQNLTPASKQMTKNLNFNNHMHSLRSPETKASTSFALRQVANFLQAHLWNLLSPTDVKMKNSTCCGWLTQSQTASYFFFEVSLPMTDS